MVQTSRLVGPHHLAADPRQRAGGPQLRRGPARRPRPAVPGRGRPLGGERACHQRGSARQDLVHGGARGPHRLDKAHRRGPLPVPPRVVGDSCARYGGPRPARRRLLQPRLGREAGEPQREVGVGVVRPASDRHDLGWPSCRTTGEGEATPRPRRRRPARPGFCSPRSSTRCKGLASACGRPARPDVPSWSTGRRPILSQRSRTTWRHSPRCGSRCPMRCATSSGSTAAPFTRRAARRSRTPAGDEGDVGRNRLAFQPVVQASVPIE